MGTSPTPQISLPYAVISLRVYHCAYQNYFIMLCLCIWSPFSINGKLREDINSVIVIPPASSTFYYMYSENLSWIKISPTFHHSTLAPTFTTTTPTPMKFEPHIRYLKYYSKHFCPLSLFSHRRRASAGRRRVIFTYLLLLLSRFSRVRLCATPWTAAHQAPLSLGFPRQEYWSRLPFPSPMHACMLSRFSRVRLCAALWTAAHQAPLSMGFSRQEYSSALPFHLPNSG